MEGFAGRRGETWGGRIRAASGVRGRGDELGGRIWAGEGLEKVLAQYMWEVCSPRWVAGCGKHTRGSGHLSLSRPQRNNAVRVAWQLG